MVHGFLRVLAQGKSLPVQKLQRAGALAQMERAIYSNVREFLYQLRSGPGDFDFRNSLRFSQTNMLAQRIPAKARSVSDRAVDVSLGWRCFQRNVDFGSECRTIRLNAFEIEWLGSVRQGCSSKIFSSSAAIFFVPGDW